MRRPGFSLLQYDAEQRKASVVRMSVVDNKLAKKSHGQMLSEIAHELHTYLKEAPDAVLVREAALFSAVGGTVKTVAVLHKVVGISDLYAWATGQKEFEEISALTVKKLLTGDSKASKEEVAAALEKYVGKLKYETDDESDSVACGVAWLIRKKYIDQEDG